MATHATVVRRSEAGFDELRSGFNTAIEHHPEVIFDASSPADVVAAVRLAAKAGRPVAVMNTGHGASVPADGGVLIRTGRMKRVDVDPVRKTAKIEAGAAWRDVIEAAARFGLAPLNGSSPHVGAVGYTLGGGVGLLSRRFGFAADHVRWIDVVTADGRARRVTADADSEADLFWALRGAGACLPGRTGHRDRRLALGGLASECPWSVRRSERCGDRSRQRSERLARPQ